MIRPFLAPYSARMPRPRKTPPLVPGHPSDVPEPIPVQPVPLVPEPLPAMPDDLPDPKTLKRAILTPQGWLCPQK